MIYKGKRYTVSRYGSQRTNIEANDVGRDILGFISYSPPDSDLDTLIGRLRAEYDVDEATLRSDVCEFIDGCIEKDVLTNRAMEEESDRVIARIQALQAEIPELTVSDFGYVVRLGGTALTPGCESCKRGRWAVFFLGPQCNLSCYFCPYTGVPERGVEIEDSADVAISFLGYRFPTFRELQFQFSLIHDNFDGFAWVGGEPMLPKTLETILPRIRYFHETYPTYHQWLYTNGTFATRENMQRLRDAGIRELRFNLGATDFRKKIIGRMKEAREIFDYVCLETPMLKGTYEALLANIDAILDTGLDQLNLAEFIVGRNHLTRPDDLRQEGRLYSYKDFITSPIQSRLYTYDILRRAAAEKWPVVINDCSNEYKYYKLAIQENRNARIFQGKSGYWNNNFPIAEVDSFNERL